MVRSGNPHRPGRAGISSTRVDLTGSGKKIAESTVWKSKYQELQASIKRLKNRVADVTKSREQWKLKAEQTNNQLTVLEAENASLRAQVATLAEKKTTRPSQG